MKLKVVNFFFCIMILITIPIVQGLNIKNIPDYQIPDVLTRTAIRGIVLFPRISSDGKTINFFAIRMNYRTISLEGINYGIVKL